MLGDTLANAEGAERLSYPEIPPVKFFKAIVCHITMAVVVLSMVPAEARLVACQHKAKVTLRLDVCRRGETPLPIVADSLSGPSLGQVAGSVYTRDAQTSLPNGGDCDFVIANCDPGDVVLSCSGYFKFLYSPLTGVVVTAPNSCFVDGCNVGGLLQADVLVARVTCIRAQ